MSGLKIVVIGAGSSYTPELIEGLIKRQHELPLRELWLVDIEDGREKMNIIANLTRRMLAKAGLAVNGQAPRPGRTSPGRNLGQPCCR